MTHWLSGSPLVVGVVSAKWRAVHLTPPGSECSIIFGEGLTSTPPGVIQGLYLIVPDVEAARAEFAARGVDVSEVCPRRRRHLLPRPRQRGRRP
ncbi:hypothetical protein AB0O67_26740 [Streptomyces sp. NPDC086077]|uniref:hypothetical protein n=1 Tax=Streptomyces sp. NPDC086077 TaxID=3154862 RepID=UPI0034335323